MAGGVVRVEGAAYYVPIWMASGQGRAITQAIRKLVCGRVV